MSLLVSVAFFVLLAQVAFPQVPNSINYQGRLLDGTNLVNGQVSLILRLYDSESGGTLLCANSNTVDVVDGLYSTYLGDNVFFGSLQAAFTGEIVWAETSVDGTTLSPRERIVAVAYAIKADSVSTGAITSAMIASGAVGSLQLADNAVNSNNIAIGAIHSENIAIGAVDSLHLANGAVTSNKLAADSVGRDKLVKAYESGRLNVEFLAQTNVFSFEQVEVTKLVAFSEAFSVPPIVTLSVSSSNRTFAREAIPAVLSKSAVAFSCALYFSPETVVIDSHAASGYDYSSLTVVNGRPAAATADASLKTLRFSRAEDAYGIRWTPPVTASTNQNGVFGYPSLAVVDGYPAIAFRDKSNWLSYVRALDINGTNWGTEVVIDTNGNTGYYTFLLEVSGHPAIAYRRSDGNLLYARSDTAAGTNAMDWYRIAVDTNASVTDPLSMAIIDGYPAITYYDGLDDDLRFVRADNAQGTTWSDPVLVYTNGYTGRYPSLVELDSTYPAISFRDSTSNKLMFVSAKSTVGTNWYDPTTVLTNGGTYSKALVIDGYPCIAGYDGGPDDVIYVRSDSSSGFSWDDPITVVSNGSVGDYNSFAEVMGAPAILYRNNTDDTIDYIRSGNPPANSWLDWIAVEP